MKKNISDDRFFSVEKIRRKNLNEEMKAPVVVVDKANAILVQEQFENKEAKLRKDLMPQAEAIVLNQYGATKADKNYSYYIEQELNNLVKDSMRKQMRKRNTKAVDKTDDTLPISHVTSSSIGLKSTSQRVDLNVDSDNLEDKIDRRNQIFKIKENYIEVEGELIRDVQFKFAHSFRSFYWVSDGRIVVGEERPLLKAGQFSLYNRGIMNSKKASSLAFAGAKVLGCLPEEVSFVWYQSKPHMFYEPNRALLEINIVDGKAFGYKDGIKHI